MWYKVINILFNIIQKNVSNKIQEAKFEILMPVEIRKTSTWKEYHTLVNEICILYHERVFFKRSVVTEKTNYWLYCTRLFLFPACIHGLFKLAPNSSFHLLTLTLRPHPFTHSSLHFSRIYLFFIIPFFRGVKPTTHLKLVPRLRMHETISPLPHTSSWRGT
jgi:hypothetical protein